MQRAEGAVIVHVGACGSGKTWRLKARVAAAVRSDAWRGVVWIADVKGEWPTGVADGASSPLVCGSHIDIGRATVPRITSMRRVVICSPPSHDPEDTSAWLDELARRALEREGVLLVVPEVYRYARERERMVKGLEVLAHEHRHHACALWVDCQSFPEVSKELLRRAGWVCIHGTGAYEDVRRLERMGGRELALATLDAQHRNVSGRAGHHVWFRTGHPFGPYVVLDPEGRSVATFGEQHAAADDDGRTGGSAGGGHERVDSRRAAIRGARGRVGAPGARGELGGRGEVGRPRKGARRR